MSRIKVNIGGKLFESTLETLCKAPLFKSHYSNFDVNDEIFVDGSPIIFEHVLCLLRNPNYKFPKEYLDELKLYGIDSKLVSCDNNNKENEEIKSLFQEIKKELEE